MTEICRRSQRRKQNYIVILRLRDFFDGLKVNREVESSRTEVHSEPYYAGEHILVCLSSSPSNAKVIRTAARFADAFHASFTALFVETPHTRELNERNRSRLRENLKLAEQLGAKIATVYGDDVPYQISEYAKVSGVSKIVMGRSSNRPGLFLSKSNFVERLTALAPNLDVYIIPDALSPRRPKAAKIRLDLDLNLPDFLKTVGILTLCTLIGQLFFQLALTQINIVTVYILGVLVISNQTRSRIYGLGSSVVSVLAYNYFFTEPRYTLNASGAEYPLTFLVMLTASLITSSLTMRVRRQARAAAVNAHRTGILLETSRKLQRAGEFEDIVEKSSQQLSRLLNRSVLFFPAKDGELQKPLVYPIDPDHPLPPEYSDEEEYAVAVWVFRNGRPAGSSTDTLPGAKALYLPVKGDGSVPAVIGIPMRPGSQLEIFERSLLDGMMDEIAVAIEKYNLNEKQNQAAMNAEKERLRANLLRAISHDLRTPLTSISGNASVLLDDGGPGIGSPGRHRLLEDIYEDSLWLINLVENILAVTRIDDGRLNMKTQPELVQDLVAEALLHIDRHGSEHKIEVRLENELLMVRADAHLIIQVIINIVNNAIAYTPADSLIVIRAYRKEQWVYLEISDNGKGIPDPDKKQIFDMFYTANNAGGDSRRGLGLGLSLCKSIVNAHGGEIFVRDNQPHGTVFGFSLPWEEIDHDG